MIPLIPPIEEATIACSVIRGICKKKIYIFFPHTFFFQNYIFPLKLVKIYPVSPVFPPLPLYFSIKKNHHIFPQLTKNPCKEKGTPCVPVSVIQPQI